MQSATIVKTFFTRFVVLTLSLFLSMCFMLTGKVLWDFYEWKQLSVGASEFQQVQPSVAGMVDNMMSFLDFEQLGTAFWADSRM